MKALAAKERELLQQQQQQQARTAAAPTPAMPSVRLLAGITCSATLTGHTDFVQSVAFTPDGATLVSGSWDETIRCVRVL